MYSRSKYKDIDETSWMSIRNPVATIKYDGANFFMPVSSDGSLSFISRRPSVKGGYPDRTLQLPQLTDKKYPELAGHVYNVELIHTGFNKANVESHRIVSGILNSLPARSIDTQNKIGPVRAVLHNVINPDFPTYKDKMDHLKRVESFVGKPDLIYAAKTYSNPSDIHSLIRSTKAGGQEGVIITSLTEPEDVNVRYKVKHKEHYNLKITDIIQEIDKDGNPKQSMGAVVVCDASGRQVAKVGSGFSRNERIDAWNNPKDWIGRLIQVETMGLAHKMLRMPIYNGDADGDIDTVE